MGKKYYQDIHYTKQTCRMYVRQNLHGQSLGFHCFIVILKAGSKSIDLIILEISSHILGSKYDDSVVWKSSVENLFLETSQNSQENTCTRVEFCEICKNTIRRCFHRSGIKCFSIPDIINRKYIKG